MKKLTCKIIGHREYAEEVLAQQLWNDREYRGVYSMLDFREPSCLRCGEDLHAAA